MKNSTAASTRHVIFSQTLNRQRQDLVENSSDVQPPAVELDIQEPPVDVQLGGEAADTDIQAWVKDLHHIAVGVKAESGALAEEWDKTLRENARLLQMLEGGGRPYLLTWILEG
jgi:hypothetical protein